MRLPGPSETASRIGGIIKWGKNQKISFTLAVRKKVIIINFNSNFST